jgi:nickel-type superoxide dismutase maturation protease
MRPTGPLGLLLVLLVGLAVRRSLDVVEVRGRSMAPTLQPGDRLLAMRLRRPARVGEIVLAADPRDPRRELVKRVASAGRTRVHLRGDNPAASTDARSFGAVATAAIEWRVVWRYWPPGSIGRPGARPLSSFETDEGGESPCAVPEALVTPG